MSRLWIRRQVPQHIIRKHDAFLALYRAARDYEDFLKELFVD